MFFEAQCIRHNHFKQLLVRNIAGKMANIIIKGLNYPVN